MSIDFNKLKKLILIFAELDEEYQSDLMTHAIVLSVKQSQKKRNPQKDFKPNTPYHPNTYEEMLTDKAYDVMEVFKKCMELYDQLDAQGKAMLFAATNQLSGGALTKETDIEIKLSHKKVSLESLLREIAPGADFDQAIKDADRYITEYKKSLV